MKSGIELIADERQEQIRKHGRTVDMDVELNGNEQLSEAACILVRSDADLEGDVFRYNSPPQGWDLEVWQKMYNKPYKERLIIAGALIAAEIDRLNYVETEG